MSDVTAVKDPWECEYGDYDSIPVCDEAGEVTDSIGIIEDCSKESPPYCKFCPKRFIKVTP